MRQMNKQAAQAMYIKELILDGKHVTIETDNKNRYANMFERVTGFTPTMEYTKVNNVYKITIEKQ